MAELGASLGALAVIVLPLVLAWWLLGRTSGAARDRTQHLREKMPLTRRSTGPC